MIRSLVFLMRMTLAAEAETLRGKVLDARKGEPQERVRVEVAAGGVFRIENVPAGAVNLSVSAPSSGLLKVQAETWREVDIALQPDADRVNLSLTVASNVFEWAEGKAIPTEHLLRKRELQSLGLGLDEGAVKCVKNWRFSPPHFDCRGEVVGVRIQVQFRLLR
jgi:hypothetical protein